jgi:hypothetical protein
MQHQKTRQTTEGARDYELLKKRQTKLPNSIHPENTIIIKVSLTGHIFAYLMSIYGSFI